MMRDVEAIERALADQGCRVHWARVHAVCFSTPSMSEFAEPPKYLLGGPDLQVFVMAPCNASDLRSDIDAATACATRALRQSQERAREEARNHRAGTDDAHGQVEARPTPSGASSVLTEPATDDPFAGIHE